MTINIDSSEQSRVRLQLHPTPRPQAPPRPTLGFVLCLARPEATGSASPDPEAAGFASPDRDPYHRQPLQVQTYGPGSKL